MKRQVAAYASTVILPYALLGRGQMMFAVLPVRPAPGWGKTMGLAALLDFFAYATSDLKNLATLTQWPIGLSATSMTWRTYVSAAAAAGDKGLIDWAAPL